MRPRVLFAGLLALTPFAAFAQGQDGTPAERNLQIIAELLPGNYDNANQAYFDQRFPEYVFAEDIGVRVTEEYRWPPPATCRR